jgi:hypothetical protein
VVTNSGVDEIIDRDYFVYQLADNIHIWSDGSGENFFFIHSKSTTVTEILRIGLHPS